LQAALALALLLGTVAARGGSDQADPATVKADTSTMPPAVGGDSRPPIDKSDFTFFHPTPTNLLRELSVDGPGATESPYTVDAGHFQAELTLADYNSERNRSKQRKRRDLTEVDRRFEAFQQFTI
jgi:hypothetical protein